MKHGLLDVCKRMLYDTAEGMTGNGLLTGPHCSNCSLCGLGDTVSLKCRDLTDNDTELPAQLLRVDLFPCLLQHVHHVDCENNRNTELSELCRKVEVSLQVGSVDDVDDDIGAFPYQELPCHFFLRSICGKGVDSGKVDHGHILVALQFSFLLLNGYTWPVSHILIGTRKCIE